MRVLLLLFLVILGCARSEPVTVNVEAEPTGGAPGDSPRPPLRAAPAAATALPDNGYGPSCRERGVEPLNPCPRGIPWSEEGPGGPMPEALPYCCASGPLQRAEAQPCFAVERASRYCGPDPDGKAAARARIEAWAKRYGEPCKDPQFRKPFGAYPGFQQICAERGYP